MPDTPIIPAGWYVLDKGTVIHEGDKFYACRQWWPSGDIGRLVPDTIVYIRKGECSPKEKYFRGYRISLGYKRVTVFTYDTETHQRVSSHTCTPFNETKKFTRRERYEIIAERLRSFGIIPPAYKELKK